MAILRLLAGMIVRSCRARAALRIRVSMSEMGSVIIVLPYQLALMTPGISPRSAKLRKQMRHSSNFRM